MEKFLIECKGALDHSDASTRVQMYNDEIKSKKMF